MREKTYQEGYYDGVVEAMDKLKGLVDESIIENIREGLLK